MDLLFTEYASPFILLDSVIPAGELCAFLDTFDEQVEERQLWDFYTHKLSALDERTFEEFKDSVKPKKIRKATTEELEATVKRSYDMMKNFRLEGGA